jgi:hypothetical protein
VGPIQTYYYLGLIGLTFVAFALLLVWIAFTQVRRMFRLGISRLTAWVIAGAVALLFLFFTVGSIGIVIGMVQSVPRS